jgi:hypothetical protein
MAGVTTMMVSWLAQFARKLWSRLSTTANPLFRHITWPASPNLVTGTLADLLRSRAQLLAQNAVLRQHKRFSGRWW